MKMAYPKNYKPLQSHVEYNRCQQVNIGAYSLFTTQVPSTEETTHNDNTPHLIIPSPTPSFDIFMLEDTSEENSQSQISITKDFFNYEDQSFNL